MLPILQIISMLLSSMTLQWHHNSSSHLKSLKSISSTSICKTLNQYWKWRCAKSCWRLLITNRNLTCEREICMLWSSVNQFMIKWYFWHLGIVSSSKFWLKYVFTYLIFQKVLKSGIANSQSSGHKFTTIGLNQNFSKEGGRGLNPLHPLQPPQLRSEVQNTFKRFYLDKVF